METASSRESDAMQQKSLPQGWRWVELGEVCEVRKGVTPRRVWYADSGLHIIKFRDIGGEINWEPGLRGRVKPQYEGKLRRLQAGMTLIGADAHNPEYIGKKVSFADSIPEEPVFFSGELLAIAAKPDGRIVSKWPFLWFSSQGGYMAVQEKVVGVHLNSNPAKTIEIPLPPISEQKRIIGILENRLGAVEKAQRAALDRVEAAQALGAAFLREVFEFGNGKLPRGWSWVNLESVCKTTSGGTPPRNVKEFYGGSIPWVKSGELNDGTVSQTEETITQSGVDNSSAKIFPKGTLLIALYGATVGKLGVLDIKAATNQAVCAIFPDKSVNRDYLFLFLLHTKKDLVNASFGGAQPNISQKVVRSLQIPLPPLSKQRQIVATLDAKMAIADQARAAAEAELEAIEALPGALLRQAFKGEL